MQANYPNCGGLLLVELDGNAPEVETLMEEVADVCTKCGAWEIHVAQSDAERARVWTGRKAAFAAVGRLAPAYIEQYVTEQQATKNYYVLLEGLRGTSRPPS